MFDEPASAAPHYHPQQPSWHRSSCRIDRVVGFVVVAAAAAAAAVGDADHGAPDADAPTNDGGPHVCGPSERSDRHRSSRRDPCCRRVDRLYPRSRSRPAPRADVPFPAACDMRCCCAAARPLWIPLRSLVAGQMSPIVAVGAAAGGGRLFCSSGHPVMIPQTSGGDSFCSGKWKKTDREKERRKMTVLWWKQDGELTTKRDCCGPVWWRGLWAGKAGGRQRSFAVESKRQINCISCTTRARPNNAVLGWWRWRQLKISFG